MTPTNQTHPARDSTRPPRLSLKNVLLVAGLAALACALICLSLPGVLINPLIERRFTSAFAEAYPGTTVRTIGLHYSIWENRLDCDSLSVMTPDSSPAFSAAGITISGVDRFPLILGRGVTPDGFGDAHASARNIVLNLRRSAHEFRFANLRISGPDSTLTIEGLRCRPRLGDDRFFAGSEYRRTRFHLDVPLVRVTGLAWVTPGNLYRARDVVIQDASVSVLINKEKPVNDAAAPPRMPAEILASLGGSWEVRTVRFLNGRLNYQERFEAGIDPAVLTFDSVRLTATGIGNAAGRADTMFLRARGIMMGAGELSLSFTMPVATTGLSFRFSGALTRMDLARLNPFVERAEALRLKTGVVHSAAFGIDVKAGRADGSVHAAYEDLSVASINDETGSESGVVNTFRSLIANNLTLRTTNMPDASDSLRVGEVRYDKRSEQAFLEFSWFALRSGISDVVGF